MSEERLDYASPRTQSAEKRTAGQWAILFATWLVGLIIWAAYIVGIGLLVLRIL